MIKVKKIKVVVGGRRIFDVDDRRRRGGGGVWRSDNHLNAAVVEHRDGGDVTIVMEKVAIEEEGLSGSGYAMVFLNLLFDLKNTIEETQFDAERLPSLRFKYHIHGTTTHNTRLVGVFTFFGRKTTDLDTLSLSLSLSLSFKNQNLLC